MDTPRPDSPRAVADAFWRTANARDWAAFQALLHPDMVYDVPQTRERVRGAADFTEFYRTWPGPWRVEVRQCIADDERAVTVLDFITDTQTMPSLAVLTVRDGRVVHIDDWWPEPYEPPPGVTPVVQRY